MPTNAEQPVISIVTPVYGCRGCLMELARRVRQTMEGAGLAYELIMVNDASPDDAWSVIRELGAADPCVKGLDLSRNFGQHYAITAGLDYARGDYAVVMDCDLQDEPESIPDMLAKAREGYDVVRGVSPCRSSGSLGYRLLSGLYYRTHDVLTGSTTQTKNSSFTLMSRRATDCFVAMRERRRQLIGIFQHMGFRVGEVSVPFHTRPGGGSSYSIFGRIRLALFGITSSTTRLLRLGVYLGLTFAAVSFCVLAYIVFNKIYRVDYQAGWASVISSIFFVGGTILVILGILGVYLETIFYEVKRRPIYLLKDMVNLSERRRTHSAGDEVADE